MGRSHGDIGVRDGIGRLDTRKWGKDYRDGAAQDCSLLKTAHSTDLSDHLRQPLSEICVYDADLLEQVDVPDAETPTLAGGRFVDYAGDHLISHTLTRAVPSAQRGLTSVFGMGTGVTLAVNSPANI